MIGRFRVGFAWLLSLVSVLALCLRWWVRDRVPVLDLIYYATPLIVTALCLSAAGALWLSAGRPVPCIASFTLALFLGALWIRSPAPDRIVSADEVASTRLVFWNVGWGQGGWHEIARTVRSSEFDIMGLVEAHADEGFWKGVFPEAFVIEPSRGLVLIAKAAVESVSVRRFGRRSRIATFRVDGGRGPLLVHLVDLEPSLLSPRRPLLHEVATVALRPTAFPSIIMGDFNTPHDSLWLEELRSRFVNAHEAHGSVPAPTWPIPVPVIAIDQIWVDRRLPVLAARTRATWLSDHALLHVTVGSFMRSGFEGEALGSRAGAGP